MCDKTFFRSCSHDIHMEHATARRDTHGAAVTIQRHARGHVVRARYRGLKAAAAAATAGTRTSAKTAAKQKPSAPNTNAQHTSAKTTAQQKPSAPNTNARKWVRSIHAMKRKEWQHRMREFHAAKYADPMQTLQAPPGYLESKGAPDNKLTVRADIKARVRLLRALIHPDRMPADEQEFWTDVTTRIVAAGDALLARPELPNPDDERAAPSSMPSASPFSGGMSFSPASTPANPSVYFYRSIVLSPPALSTACIHNNLEHVNHLLDEGHDVNEGTKMPPWTRRPSGETALMMACKLGRVPCTELLLRRSADVNQQQEDGATALLTACRKGNYGCVALLLRHGAEADRSARCVTGPPAEQPEWGEILDELAGQTPLTAAIQWGHWGCVALLLQSGCNPDTSRLLDKLSPLQVALADRANPPWTDDGVVALIRHGCEIPDTLLFAEVRRRGRLLAQGSAEPRYHPRGLALLRQANEPWSPAARRLPTAKRRGALLRMGGCPNRAAPRSEKWTRAPSESCG